MRRCARCKRSYRGESPHCDPCREFKKQLHREDRELICLHCGQLFMPGSFDQHRWRIYYRDRFFPRSARRRK